MLTIINDAKESKRLKDENGFLIIKQNPIARAGVFDYLLSEINPNSNSEELVRVYRDYESLFENKDTFANKPIMYNHNLVGKYGEATKADGAIGSEISGDGEFLIADLIIYNPDLIEKIEKGEVIELSPSYVGEIVENSGRFNGIDYSYKQSIKCVNHLAVVEKGRSGYELRIQDSKFTKGNKMDLKKIVSKLRLFADEAEKAVETQDEALSKDEIIKEIVALSTKADSEFQGGEAEKADLIAKLANRLTLSDTQDEAEDTEAETPLSVENNDDGEVKEVENNDDGEVKELLETLLSVIDKKINEKLALNQEAQRQELDLINDSYNEVSRVLGSQFNYNGMSQNDIYKFGYECLAKNSLGDGLDSKTAFKMLADSRQQKQVKFSDSKDNKESAILKALENLKRG